MKKSMLTLGLLFVISQSTCGFFDNAMAFLKKTAGDLLDKGKKYLSDNSGKILGAVVEKGSGFVKSYLSGGNKEAVLPKPSTTTVKPGMGIQEAEKLVLNTANIESDSEEKEIVSQAKNIVATNKELTPAEQQAILQEAQRLANQNRAALMRQAEESIAQKRETLKSSIYEKIW